MPSPVQALSFDLDDTLWDVWPVIAAAENKLHAWLRPRYPRIVEMFRPEQLRALCSEIAATHPHREHDKSFLRLSALRLAAERADYNPNLAEPAFEVFYAARQEVELFEDVLPVLERLKRRWPIGALSNGNAELRLVGLDHLFDFQLRATDVGVAKPAPDMFKTACARLGCAPEQVVHIGDDPLTDVLGAARTGMRTVWVNRDSKAWVDSKTLPDATIQSLYELEALLDDWP